MTKYLLSTGKSTTKIEEYILDMFRLNLLIWPGDIPNSTIGFDFIFTDTKKDQLQSEIKSRTDNLLRKMKSKFTGIDMSITGVDLIDNERVLITVNVGGISDAILIDVT